MYFRDIINFSNYMFDIPILYLVFNRLDTVQRTLPILQGLKPVQLFIAADGPRKTKSGEAEMCQKVRDYVTSNINWECKVQTLFRDENLGCQKNVSAAISWFFDNVEMGIVLEDDCLPDMTFFPYCRELLFRYKDDPRVMHIAGDNPLQTSKLKNNESYYFEKIQHCWGWANWARSWKYFNLEVGDEYKELIKTNNYFKNKRVREDWINIFEGLKAHKIDSWAYVWSYKVLQNNGLCINPRNNLVQNIGMDSGIHFTGTNNESDGRPAIPMEFPLVHPKKIDFNYKQIRKLQQIGKDEFIIIRIIKYILKKMGIFYLLKRLIKGHV